MQIADILFDSLRRMDEEAFPRVETDGTFRTGLSWYHGHERRDVWSETADTERAWCRRLATLLPGRAPVVSVRVDERYPSGRQFADLVLTLDDGRTLWLEVKGAWTYGYQHVPLEPNRLFRKHLVGPDSSLAADFAKVANVPAPDADIVGVLLVGFEVAGVDGYTIGEELLGRVRAAAGPEWSEEARNWSASQQDVIPGRTTEDFRIHARFWSRAAVRPAAG